MNAKEFEKLVKKDKYQVFVFASPTSFPLQFGSHPWFVINKKGLIERYEILFRKNCCGAGVEGSHLHKNFLPPWQGMEIVVFLGKFHWKSTLLGSIEGDDNSLAHKMTEFIEHSKDNYPYCNNYSFVGPNSNTYAQNILDHFPECKIKLPWNSFGKSFKKNEVLRNCTTLHS